MLESEKLCEDAEEGIFVARLVWVRGRKAGMQSVTVTDFKRSVRN